MVKGIPEHIIEGAIVFNSVEAGNCLLTAYPGIPELLRLQADLLAAKNCRQAAAGLYAEAAAQHLSAGQLLPAIVAKALEWRLVRPPRKAMLKFHSAVEVACHDRGPLNAFLQKLAPLERMALFARFERRVIPAGNTLVKIGDPENGLSLVVCGQLRENRYHTIDEKANLRREACTTLREGSFFGDIYPLREAVCSSTIIDTLTRVEVVTLTKRRLIQLCWKHPNLQEKLFGLFRLRYSSGDEPLSCAVRRGERYKLPVRMTVEIPANGKGGPPKRICGYTQDLSVTGMSFIVDSGGIEAPPDQVPEVPENGSQNVRVSLPLEGLSISISGQIVRVNKMVVNGFRTFALCIEFDEIPPRLRGTFLTMAGFGNGLGSPRTLCSGTAAD
jgi:CRP-like cAMP-binding protein